MSGLGPQMGIACAFKSDLNGKVDESKGILLPVRGLLLFSKPNEHPRVDFGAPENDILALIRSGRGSKDTR